MWSVKYCLLIFVGVMGIIQLAAARNNFRGLFIFPSRQITWFLGILGTAVPVVAFFTWNELTGARVIEGCQQTGSFVLSAAAGIVFTILLSSLINFRHLNPGISPLEGMDFLKDGTVLQKLRISRSDKAR
jgi:hypothetical protein